MSTRMGYKRWLLILACALAAVPARTSHAFLTEGVSWQNGMTSFNYILPTGSVAQSNAINSAMQEWNAVTAFRFAPVPSSADPCDSRQPNSVALTAKMCDGKAFGGSTLAVTFYDGQSQ